MRNCEEILLEFGVDFLENEKVPEEINTHFKNCLYCIKELEKQKNVLNIFEKKLFKDEKIPKLYLPPVLRKTERYQFLALSTFFFLFFLGVHSILNFEFLKPYILIFSNFGFAPIIQLNIKIILLIIILLSLTFTIYYQIKKFLKKL